MIVLLCATRCVTHDADKDSVSAACCWEVSLYTPCLKKTVQNCFCQNFVKFAPILIIFGRKMVKRLKLCELHSFSTSPNSSHHTTMLNADVRNCYTTLKVVICSIISNNLNSTSKVKCGLFSSIIDSYNSLVQNCQNLCSEWAPCPQRQALRQRRHVKPHLQLHVFCGVVAFAASREYVSVQGWRG